MRASLAAVLVVLLLAPAIVEAATPTLRIHRSTTTSAWWAERFTTADPKGNVSVDLESFMAGEILSHNILLYDGSGRLLRGSGALYPGDGASAGNRVDVNVGIQGARVTTDESGIPRPVIFRAGARDPVKFLCDAACNPSREFVLVVFSASDNITQTGFILSVPQATSLANASGTSATVLTGRMFDGTTLHVGVLGDTGIGIAEATATASIAHSLVGLFEGPETVTLAADEPSGERATCSCFWTRGSAGTYQFRLDDTDAAAGETYLAYADVAFP